MSENITQFEAGGVYFNELENGLLIWVFLVSGTGVHYIYHTESGELETATLTVTNLAAWRKVSQFTSIFEAGVVNFGLNVRLGDIIRSNNEPAHNETLVCEGVSEETGQIYLRDPHLRFTKNVAFVFESEYHIVGNIYDINPMVEVESVSTEV